LKPGNLNRGSGGGAFERASEFLRRTLELVVDRIEPIEGGWVARAPSLPLVWVANQVRVSRPIGYAEALALAEEHQRELPYRQLAVDHEASARRLERAFRAAGWEVGREVIMALTRPADREVDTGAVIDAPEEDALALVRRWLAEDPDLDETDEGLDQVSEFNRLTWRARDARRLGMLDGDGSLGAVTMLFSDGDVAQVEDVYTVPEARGRGFARALVTHAVSLARADGHELVFIVADADDWPKQLYEKVGFDAVGLLWEFHRKRGG
jgi:ribosomal protein S18 acetylase RimI-like enzyme